MSQAVEAQRTQENKAEEPGWGVKPLIGTKSRLDPP